MSHSAGDLSHVRIIGSGLIGTSIGLALCGKGISVEMVDSDTRAEAIARDLTGYNPGDRNPDVVIFASPISTLRELLSQEFSINVKSTFMDISSVKTKPQQWVNSSEIPSGQFLLSHPMAGREVGGAESARADLFVDRPWIIDSTGVNPDSLALAKHVIDLCGATIFDMPATEHDQAVALISHLPQIGSSLVAAQLVSGDPRWLSLSGGGLRDTTRIAASNPELWSEIISSNSVALQPLLLGMREQLDRLISHLDSPESIKEFIALGNRGRAAIPGKHGGVTRDYSFLPVIIDDKPGQLAALFHECDTAGVNVEDVSIEHSPGQQTGLVILSLSPSDATILQRHLDAQGWSVHSPRGDSQ